MLQSLPNKVMLQPRKMLVPKRTFFSVNLSVSSLNFFSLLSLLAVLPLKVYTHSIPSEYTDELFIVGPTPALRLNEEDLTTVLLVSNDNGRGDQVHGRFLNFRPEVGLLTSTARTFIQEGVTTEYATQVLGKTLRNGSSYAQLLKRSSRILYEPSVVTSWVGESAQTKSILQSHNDLQNDEQADWKDIDDRLLAKNDFVGNTDYVISHEINLQKPVINATKTITSSTSSSISLTESLQAAGNFVGHKSVDEDARKIIANKILPFGDLPTYTVKNYFSPSRFSWRNDSTDSTFDTDVRNSVVLKDKPRSPKVYYNKIIAIPVRMKNSAFIGVDRSMTKSLDASRVLSTITYYGFANFTTMVGDSVIVFSPSTSNSNYGHVTSIKGEATLDGTNTYVSNVITITEDSIVPTYVKESSLQTSDETIQGFDLAISAIAEYPMGIIEHEQKTPKTATEKVPQTATELISSTDNLQTELVSLIVEDGAKQSMTVMVDSSSTWDEQFSTISQTVLLSRPSNEDILRIYASLASVETAKRALPTLHRETEFDTTTVESNVTKEETAIPTLKSSEMKIDGGATTFNYEDDPFANYVEFATVTSSESNKLSFGESDFPTESSSIIIRANKTVAKSDTSHNEDLNTPTVATTLVTVVNEDRANTTVNEDLANAILIREKEEKGQHSTTITPQPDNVSKTQNLSATIIVKEIEADEEVNSLNCLRTSQVFLTQLPKFDTYFTTYLISEEQEIEKISASVKTNILPTFTIEQATKFYCLQSAKVVKTMREMISMQLERPATEVMDDKSDNINIGSTMTNTVPMTTIRHNQHVTEVSNDRLAMSDIDYDTTEEAEDQEIVAEEVIKNNGARETSSEEEIDIIYKTLYTTYTYLTTFFHDDTTSISSRKEVLTNVITSTLGPETDTQTTKLEFLNEHKIAPTPKFVVPAELESILHSDDITSSNNNPSLNAESSSMQATVYLDDSKFTKTYFTTYTYYTTIFVDGETEVMSRTGIHTNHVTDIGSNRDNSVKAVLNMSEHISASTTEPNFYSTLQLNQVNFQQSDMKVNRSISSNDDHQIINNSQMNNAVNALEDQISSESNNDEIIPAATLFLQTSFTTFTYYTTMYSGDDTNVLSRLETVTNAVTETLLPTAAVIEDATLPVTFFTTFTYWTKLSKEGDITILSREHTVSNVIVPTNMLTETDIVSVTVHDSSNYLSVSPQANNMEVNNVTDQKTSAFNVKEGPESTTFYTTFTYYTTSYLDDQIITVSRFETITKVVTPEITNPGTTILASRSALVLPPKHTATLTTTPSDTVLSDITGNVITEDSKKITDAEGISTLYYTTQVIATLDENGLPTKLTNKISSLYVDEIKKAKLITSNAAVGNADDSSTRQYKTGLVRLIEGSRIANHTTTLYQSRVIGTIIDNRYAQIIESTSSFLTEETNSLKSEYEISISSTIDKELIQSTIKPTMESVKLYSTDIKSSIYDNMEYNTDGPEEETPENRGKQDVENANISDTNFSPQQSKKHIFTPVIRPFVSRNRPQFAPRKKNDSPSIATVITRSDFTPTITATPALKQSGRFSSSRRGGFYSSAISSTPIAGFSSRRFSRLHKGPSQNFGGSILSSASGGTAFSSVRNYFSSLPTNSKRSGSVDHNYSSGEFRGLSNAYIGNARLRIKSTSISSFGQRTTSAYGFSSNSSYEGEDSAQEIASISGEEDNTTEKSRRSQNPILRFRRPPFSRSRVLAPSIEQLQSSSGNSDSGFSTRRYPLSRRTTTSASTTITTTNRSPSRSLQYPVNSSFQGRSRIQSNLFPPRGLFQTQQQINPGTDGKVDTKSKEDEESGDAEDNSDYEEDDEEGEYEADGRVNRRRRSNYSKINLLVAANVFSVRTKREADMSEQIRSNLKKRYRRPQPTVVAKEHSNVEGVIDIGPLSASATRQRSGNKSRFISRYQSHDLPHTTTTPTSVPTSNHRLIRPTRPTTSRAQFTLRDKDTTASTQKSLSRSGLGSFRRPKTAASSRRASTPPSGSRRSSSKSYAHNNAATESTFRSSSLRSRDKGTTIRTRGTNMRARNRNEFIAESVLPAFDGTITVTHVIPADITIPIINGKQTEYKNVVTAKTSTEILGPQQYKTFIGSNGQPSTALTREDITVNFAGATELTQYVLHESSTTTIIFTPTTIRGRKTSFSHIIPSSVYSVENVVSTSHPQISANAPLANILLSHLLLGNIGLPANPLLGVLGDAVTQPTQQGAQYPVTEYRTHTSTYVTTVFEGKSTVLPLTFQGKKIFTTIFDTSAQTITASEFITDTIVTTPTQQPVQVNSLLLQHLFLQQPKLEQQQSLILQSKPPSSLLLPKNLQDLDIYNIRVSNDTNDIDDLPTETNTHKSTRKKNRKLGKSNRHKQPATSESSVITLYVSGRRPGEFSTVLSTVALGHGSGQHKRYTGVHRSAYIDTLDDYYASDGSEAINEYVLPEAIIFDLIDYNEKGNAHTSLQLDRDILDLSKSNKHTKPLESVVGDVSLWYNISTAQFEQLLQSMTSTKAAPTKSCAAEEKSKNILV